MEKFRDTPDSSKMKRARPQGLGVASKKERTEEEINNENTVAQSEVSEENGKLFYELPEDATALDQLRALFESATMLLGTILILDLLFSFFI